MKREKIKLTEEELEDFDFTGGSVWELRGETYNFIKKLELTNTQMGHHGI